MSSTTITASYTIIPNEPTPNSPLILSDSDQLARWSHSATIYVYKENPTTSERMRESLSKILVHYYPIAGSIRWAEGGRVELNCNAKGVMFIEAQSTKTLAQLGDLAPNNDDTLKYEFVPKIDYTQPLEEIPLLIVQLTKLFQHGVVIGISFCHVLGDGLAAISFINSWAKLCRNETLLDQEMFPFLDRTVLDSSTLPRFNHSEFMPVPLLLNTTDSVAETKMKTTASVLKLTTEQVEKLKKTANNNNEVLRFSTYEVVATHIWRCACKARGLNDVQPTVIRIPVDIRNRINPPLPQNYFGNALAVALTPVCYVKDIVNEPLRYGAGKMREAIGLLSNPEYIRSQLDFIRCQERLDFIRTAIVEIGKTKAAMFYGNPNMNITSWMSMPVYEADFGWGKPLFFGPALVLPDGKSYIMRSSSGDESLLVSVHLQSRHMELFKNFFYQDLP
jgi:shikimate O-hydroxycinnamoyltransferase